MLNKPKKFPANGLISVIDWNENKSTSMTRAELMEKTNLNTTAIARLLRRKKLFLVADRYSVIPVSLVSDWTVSVRKDNGKPKLDSYPSKTNILTWNWCMDVNDGLVKRFDTTVAMMKFLSINYEISNCAVRSAIYSDRDETIFKTPVQVRRGHPDTIEWNTGSFTKEPLSVGYLNVYCNGRFHKMTLPETRNYIEQSTGVKYSEESLATELRDCPYTVFEKHSSGRKAVVFVNNRGINLSAKTKQTIKDIHSFDESDKNSYMPDCSGLYIKPFKVKWPKDHKKFLKNNK